MTILLSSGPRDFPWPMLQKCAQSHPHRTHRPPLDCIRFRNLWMSDVSTDGSTRPTTIRICFLFIMS